MIADDEQVARWAGTPIELGGGQYYTPYVLRPDAVPQVTDPRQARADPELAVFSVMSHGQSAAFGTSVQIAVAAMAACVGLDAERSKLYVDLVLSSITEAARKALQAMKPADYEYQSEFARRYISLGRAEGKAEGKAELLIRQASLKFGALSEATQRQLRTTPAEALDQMAERLLSATTLEDMLDIH